MSLAIYEPIECEPVDHKYTDRLHFDVRRTRESPASWDCFAQACGATFRGAYRSAVAWQLKHHLVFSLARYDIYACSDTESRKIGQFAVGFGLRMRVFSDLLQILPAYHKNWHDIMQATLTRLGPATYCYGSDWTTEPSRSKQIADLNGAEIVNEKQIDVYAVDFSQFFSWDHFYKSLSNNIRRNASVAQRDGNDIIKNDQGDHLSIDNLRLLLLKKKMFTRKGLQISLTRSVVVLVFRILGLRKYLFTAKVLNKTKVVSVFCGLQFGRDMYYLEGASVDKPGGATWYLLVEMLRLAYGESLGHGKCILGPDDGTARNQKAWENLRRQRLQCRAQPFATSVITFNYLLHKKITT